MKDELITIRKSELINTVAAAAIVTAGIFDIKLSYWDKEQIRDWVKKDIERMIKSGDLQTINPN